MPALCCHMMPAFAAMPRCRCYDAAMFDAADYFSDALRHAVDVLPRHDAADATFY